MLTDLLPFLAASLVVVLLPGPDMTLVLRNAAMGGTSAARATVGGVVAGNVVLALLAVLGLTAVLRGSEVAYLALKVVGACYLVWLGVGALRDWWRLRQAGPSAPDRPRRTARPPQPGRAFRQGLLSNLFNPKVAMFYLALFPQFHVGDLGRTAGSMVLASIFVVVVVVFYVVLLAAMHTIAAFLDRRRTRRAIAGASGVALTGLGLSLLRG